MRGFSLSSVLHACVVGGLFAAGFEFDVDVEPPAASTELVLLPTSVQPPMPELAPPELHREVDPGVVDLRTGRAEPVRPRGAVVVPPPEPRRVPPERWREAATVVPPVPSHNPPPEYPASARRAGLEGRVEIEVVVSASGEPTSVRIRESSGHRALDEAAASAVWSWRFTPATRRGRPVEHSLVVPFRFKLE